MDALEILAMKLSLLDYDKPHARIIILVLELLESIWERSLNPEEWIEGTLCPIFKMETSPTRTTGGNSVSSTGRMNS